ncbi:hypothetical protein ACVIG9_005010 [Bradyrhizobium ottawaense]
MCSAACPRVGLEIGSLRRKEEYVPFTNHRLAVHELLSLRAFMPERCYFGEGGKLCH